MAFAAGTGLQPSQPKPPYEKPRGPRTIGHRLRGFTQDVMQNLTETVAWSVSEAAAAPDTYRRNAPAWNQAYTYVAERESFGGRPGTLLQARYNAISIEDPEIRTQALAYMDKLQALDLPTQSLILSYLTGDFGQELSGARRKYQAYESPEATVLEENLDLSLEDQELVVSPDDPAYSDKAAALQALFPDADLTIGNDRVAADVLTDISDYLSDKVVETGGGERALELLEEKGITADSSMTDRFKALADVRVLGAAGAAGSSLAARAAGSLGRAVGAEGIVAEIEEEGELFNEVFAEYAIGHYEPTGEWTDGFGSLYLRGFGINPGTPEFDDAVETITGAMYLLPVGGILLGKLGRRIKLARGVAGPLDVAEKVLEANRTVRRGGPLGTLAEVYRLPTRKITEVVDTAILDRFARTPEQFFEGAINGRGGKDLISVLDEAKRQYPGDSQSVFDRQVGFVKEVYGDKVPDRMVRPLLRADSPEMVKAAFVDMVSRPGGADIIKGLETKIKDIDKRLNELPADANLQETVSLRLERESLQNRLDLTFDNAPLLKYPTRNMVRSIVRGPTTRLERMIHRVVARPGGTLDIAKTVDDMPRRPSLFVPGNSNNPADALDQNTHLVSNYLRRAGVKPEVIQERIGEMGRITDPQDFFEFIEKRVFGEGGDIDQALPAGTPENIRNSIITLHDSPLEGRTYSRTRTKTARGGTEDSFVLSKPSKTGGENTPLPSRDTEYLGNLALPDVDLLIDATSTIRKAVRNMEKAGYKGANLSLAWKVPNFAAHMATLILKPAVLSSRFVAMGIRIQMEQALRMAAFGFKPFKGLPDGLSLFPGGIPVPVPHRGVGGGIEFRNARIMQELFGEGGWRMLDPDTRAPGLSNAAEGADLGMFLEEVGEGPTDRVPESTVPLRQRPGNIQNRHTEAGRSELEEASVSRIDRRLAQTGLNREKYIAWLKSDPWAQSFMADRHNGTLRQSTSYNDTPDAEPKIISGRMTRIDPDLEGEVQAPRPTVGDAEGYVYHITPPDKLESIARTGLEPRQTTYGLPEDMIPEFMRKGRVFYADSIDRSVDLAQGSEQYVVLRVKGSDVGDTTPEGLFTGSQFGFEGVEPNKLEFLGGDDQWHPVVRQDPLERATETWVDARIDYLRQLTGGDADLLDYVASGRLRTGQVSGGAVDSSGQPLRMLHQQYIEDLANINAGIKEKIANGGLLDPGEAANIEALAFQRKDVQAKLRRLVEAEGEDVLNARYVHADDKRAFRAVLKQKWTEAPDTMPPRLMVKKRRDGSAEDHGLAGDVEDMASAASAMLYRGLRPLSYVDKKGTRGSLYTQAYRRYFQELEARGYRPESAKAIAHARAGALTRDLMYDLNAKSSVHRALKDIFWFAPATQEVLYTWLVKAPSASYWPIGAAAMVSKFGLWKGVLEETGVIEQDSSGAYIVKIPGMGRFVELITGGKVKVPDTVFGRVSGLNLAFGGATAEGDASILDKIRATLTPGLSTLPNFTLGKTAEKWGGLFKDMSDIFQPYGPHATSLPQPITHLWEAAFGEPPPWEPMAPGYLKAQWDRAEDLGLQYAHAELSKQGINAPRPEDFGTFDEAQDRVILTPEQEEEYRQANADYLHQLFDLGQQYARGGAVIKLIGSTVAPMSLYTTNDEREAWLKFWNGIVVPEGFAKEGGFSDEQRQMIDDYLSDSPNSVAYTVFTSKYGKKVKELPFDESLDDAWYDKQYTGESVTLTAEEYSAKLMASESRRFYQSQLNNALTKISPDLDPWELITHGYERNAAISAYKEQYDRYLALNPEAQRLQDEQSQYWAESNDVPVQSYEAERLADTIALLKQVSPMLTGEDNIRPEELRSVQGQLAALYGDTGEFAKPNTKTEKAISWWYENVMNPYLDETATLYEQADALQSRGLDASHVYDQIRALSNKPSPTYQGQTVPSPEEVFYGNRTVEEQAAARNTWASRPVSWLTNFQRDTVGYDISPEAAKFLDDVAEFDEWFYNYIETNDISPSSAHYDQLQAWRDERLQSQAEQVGGDASEMLALNEAQPYVRLNATGFGEGVSEWGSISANAQYVVDRLEQQGLSAKGFSGDAIAVKSWFYQSIEAARAQNPDLDAAFDELSNSFPLDSGGPRFGVVLYEAVFFGNFNESYIPLELASISQP